MADLDEVITETLSEMEGEDDERVYCTINELTRKITVPSSISVFAVAGDANTNRIWFKAPQTVGDGFDLTKCTIRINYITPAGDKGTFYTQYFEQVDDNVIFSWLISRQAVRTKGTLSFVVCAIQTDENGVITDEWNSAIATAKVLAGVEPDEQETDDQVTDAVAQAKASASSAESYALRAETAANQAIESEENAGRSEDNAKESETNAKTSETNASTSEKNALTSEQNAAASETNAAASSVNAKASEVAAAGSAVNAAVSETKAKTSETNAAQSEAKAKASETAAKSSEDAAKAFETNSATSAINAALSEASAAESEENAKVSETSAKTSETNSAQSETNAKEAETAAKSSEQAAKSSEINAANSETNAALSEAKASASEANAKTFESNANEFKNNAADSAQQALNSQNAAEVAKEAAVIAQGKAETARDTAVNAANTAAANVQASLENYVTAAETAQGRAESAQTKAENAKTAAEAAAANAASTAVANAETSLNSYVTASQTAQAKAESAQTAASASETSAADSATAAAGSAADAKNTADSISNFLEQIITNKNDISALKTSGYKSVTVENITTMGELATFINTKNASGEKFLFDFHIYISDAYACTIHMYSSTEISGRRYCFVFDMINDKFYGDYGGYSDSTKLTDYFSSAGNWHVKSTMLTDSTMTLGQVYQLIKGINEVEDHLLFDVSGLGVAHMYLTAISITPETNSYRIFGLDTGYIAEGVYDEDMLLTDALANYTVLAKVDGYYEDMTVGTAENLIDVDAEPVARSFTTDTAGGTNAIESGIASIDSVLGNTIVYNQLVEDAHDTDIEGEKAVVDIPEDVEEGSNATVDYFGGRSIVWNQLIEDEHYDEQDYNSHSVDVGDTDRKVKVEAIGGKTIVWNNPVIGAEGKTVNGITYTKISNQKYHASGTIDGGNSRLILVNNAYSLVEGHKYYIGTRVSGTYTETYAIAQYHDGGNSINLCPNVRKIYTALQPGTSHLFGLIVPTGNTDEVDCDVTYYLNDLTQMFGSGNEPSTVEEFEAMFPEDYYEYNAGELMSINTKKVKIEGKNLIDFSSLFGTTLSSTQTPLPVDFSGFTTGTYYMSVLTTNDEILNGSVQIKSAGGVNIVGGGLSVWKAGIEITSEQFSKANKFAFYDGYGHTIKSVVFSKSPITEYTAYRIPVTITLPSSVPVLHSAGTVHDQIVYDAGEDTWSYIKRVGSVDLGTLSWTKKANSDSTGNTVYYYEMVKEDAKQFTAQEIANVVCKSYTSRRASVSYGSDDGIALYCTTTVATSLRIFSQAYSSATDLATALSGVYAYYELATPIETDITSEMTSFIPTEVESGGTITFIGAGVDNDGNQILAEDEHALPIPSTLAFEHADYTASIDSTHSYVKVSNGTPSIISSTSSVSVNTDTDALVDMTKMLGSGNEPTNTTDVDVIAASAYAVAHSEYNAGEIVSADVDSIKAQGKNLFDLLREADSYTHSNSVVVTKKNNGFYFNGTPTAYGTYNLSGKLNIITGKKYAVSFNKSDDSIGIRLRKSNSSDYVAFKSSSVWTATFDADYIQIYSGNTGTYTDAYIKDIQIEENDAITDYFPYTSTTHTIPDALKTFLYDNGYGWSAGDVYNEVDLVNKKFIKRVGRVDLGTLTKWSSIIPDTSTYSSPTIAGMKAATVNTDRILGLTSQTFSVSNITSIGSSMPDKSLMKYNDVICVRNTEYTSDSGLPAATGWLYYDLATPVETDISSYLDDGFESFPVEAGGTITYHESDEAFTLPIPNKVTYKDTKYAITTDSTHNYLHRTFTDTTADDGTVTRTYAESVKTGVTSIDVHGDKDGSGDNLTDLTRMGYSTAEELRYDYPLMAMNNSRAYDAGTLVSNVSTGLKTTGRNILNFEDYSTINGGVTFTSSAAEQTVTINGTASQQLGANMLKVVLKPNTTYVMSCAESVGNTTIIAALNAVINGVASRIATVTNSSHTVFTTPKYIDNDTFSVRPTVNPGTYKNQVMHIQLEEASSATDYESYHERTYDLPITTILDHDGNILFPNGLLSAGSVCDEIYEDHAVKRIARLSFNVDDMNGIEDYPGWKKSGVKDVVGSEINQPRISALHKYGNTIGVNTLSASRGDLLMLPKAVYGLTQSEWKAKHAGETIEFYIPYVEPIMVTFDDDPTTGSKNITEPLNLTYRVESGGLEIALPVDTTVVPTNAPLKANIRYNKNFVKEIVNLPMNYLNEQSVLNLCTVLGLTGTKGSDGTWTFVKN